ncbi:MAG: epoxyqueuosine reductase [Anaerolineaceae bacterium]|nr:epoxyqueuosine reductase [Anaerolineaceae bacterium]
MEKNLLSETIKSIAISSNIDILGFAAASEFINYAIPNSQRQNPTFSLPDAKTIIVAGIYIGGFSLPIWDNPLYGRTSRLYLSEFFLDVVKPLQPIVSLLREGGYQTLVCESSNQESSILPLKLAAIRAGLGWQGKNSLLISRKFGTFLALGGILTDADLPHNISEEPNLCKNCKKCQEACPSGALEIDYILAKNQCLSFQLQIEGLSIEAREKMENRVGDCEICQQVCPWNSKHLEHPLETSRTIAFKEQIGEWEDLFYLSNLIQLSEKEYEERLGKLNTSIPYKIFHRNVKIAMEHIKTIF